MFNQIPERQMHAVRWFLAIAWLILILSLFWDPLSLPLTDPNNTWSPYHLPPSAFDPETCVRVQGQCLREKAYGMGARIFWAGVVPAGIIIIFVFGHEAWRRICPLSFFSQIPRALGIQRRVRVFNPRTQTTREELAKVKSESWLGRNHLYFQLALLFLGITMRTLLVNADRIPLGLFLLLTVAASIFVGYWYAGKSWCHYFCPMAPVQLFYTGGRSLFGSKAHEQRKQVVTQSTCRSFDSQGHEKTACVSCNAPCFDIDAEKNYWEILNKPGRKMIQYSYLGFVLGFYVYFRFYAGNWDYLYSGAANRDDSQLNTLFSAGFYFFERAIPIPKIIAAPLTLAAFVVASYFLFCQLEKLYRGFRQQIKKPIEEKMARHHVFTACTFISFNTFFIFAGPSLLSLLFGPVKDVVYAQEIFNGLLMLVSGIWLYRTLNRSQEEYTRESLSESLRRQLAKLSIDFSQVLAGRSLEELNTDEVYILGKVLPSFSKEESLKVYKGVLKEALENGNTNSANSLEVLKQVRIELGIKEEEHYLILNELGIENPDLLNPSKMIVREQELKIEGYRESLELLLLDSIESGLPLDLILKKKQGTIDALQRQYDITPEEHQRVWQELYSPDSSILHAADSFLLELRALSYRGQLLDNLSPDNNSQVFSLLKVIAIENRQKIILQRLLSILEMLKPGEETLKRAQYIGSIGGNILYRLLSDPDGEIPWQQRLHSSIYNALLPQNEPLATAVTVMADFRQADAGAPTEMPTVAREEAITLNNLGELPTRMALSEESTYVEVAETGIEANQEQKILEEYLLELLGNLDPLIRAIALYGLYSLDRPQARTQAAQLLPSLHPEEWLLAETAENILAIDSQIFKAVPTLTIQLHLRGRVEEKVFQQPAIKIGTLPLNDLVIQEPNIAPQHCLLLLDELGASAVDLGSSHGIQVGNKLVRGDRQTLEVQDTIRLTHAREPYLTIAWEMRKTELSPDNIKVGTLNKLLYLFETSFFNCLSPEDLVELARTGAVCDHERGVTICRQGEIAEEIFLLLEGSADVLVTRNGSTEVINSIKQGETIGEMAVLTKKKRSASVVTTGEFNRVLAIEAKHFERLVSQNPKLARELILVLSSRLQGIQV